MRKPGISVAFISFLSCMTVSCAIDGPVTAPEIEGLENQEKLGAVYYGASKCGDCKMTKDEFTVSWTIHYGYRLHPVDDYDTIIIPEFPKDDVLQNFNQFFSNENLSQRLGKRTICACLGEHREEDGAIFYKVHEARLFAK
ncbi:MAG TPA: hypothetical protein VEZ48_01590 [Sphingomonadaceae bacterium]|jgi:hypothetical protein|nr:hypothetical protein [Sphingomonadaceae bacterium]